MPSRPVVSARPVEVTKTELRRVITKLDDVQVELLRLRAQLLPEERPIRQETRKIARGRGQLLRGQHAGLGQLRKELAV